MALVTSWLEVPPRPAGALGRQARAARRLPAVGEAAEMARSGLVEFASHTDAMHTGILANPQGNIAAGRGHAPLRPEDRPLRGRRRLHPAHRDRPAPQPRAHRETHRREGARHGVALRRLQRRGAESLRARGHAHHLHAGRRLEHARRAAHPHPPSARGLRQRGARIRAAAAQPRGRRSAARQPRDARRPRLRVRPRPGPAGAQPLGADRPRGRRAPARGVPAGLCRPRRRRRGRRAVLSQPPPAGARRPVRPRCVATAQPHRREGLRVDAGNGLPAAGLEPARHAHGGGAGRRDAGRPLPPAHALRPRGARAGRRHLRRPGQPRLLRRPAVPRRRDPVRRRRREPRRAGHLCAMGPCRQTWPRSARTPS